MYRSWWSDCEVRARMVPDGRPGSARAASSAEDGRKMMVSQLGRHAGWVAGGAALQKDHGRGIRAT